MSKVPYSKPPLSYSEQLNQLIQRGLNIEDKAKAIHLLECISYYRLSGYWYPMLEFPKSNHLFKPNSTFNDCFNLYCFDREFRKLILGELEKIEVAVRAKMIYHLWHKHGAFWYQENHLFMNNSKFDKTQTQLQNEYKRSDEEFIKSFNKKYSDPCPPACMVLEISSFGNLSGIFKNLKPGVDKRAIAKYFGLDDTTFASWLHSFSYVRNICAHHSRLWNKKLGISPKIPTSPANLFLKNTIITKPQIRKANNDRPYFIICMIVYFLNTINPKHSFKTKLFRLFEKYPNIDIKSIGFPDDWQSEKFWE